VLFCLEDVGGAMNEAPSTPPVSTVQQGLRAE